MSSLYIKAADFPYYFKDDPRELSVFDSLAFVDNFSHFTEGQAGIVMRTLAGEVRRLNRANQAYLEFIKMKRQKGKND